MTDNLLRASPELVIYARNGHTIAVFYLHVLCITRYKYGTNTGNSFGQIKIIIFRKEITELYRICDRQRFQIAVTTLRRQ